MGMASQYQAVAAPRAPAKSKPSKSKEKPAVDLMPSQVSEVATVEQQIEQHAQNVERIQRDAIMEIGRELKLAQDLFRFKRDEGGFTGWLAGRLPHISQSAAYNAIQMFDGVGKFPELWNLSDAAKLQASTAEPDVKAIIAERVAAGEVFTAAQVKEIKEAAAKEAEDFKARLDASEKAALDAAETTKAETEKRLKEIEVEAERPAEAPEQPAFDLEAAITAATLSKQEEIDALKAKIDGIENDPTMKAMREAALDAAKAAGKSKASRKNPLHNPNQQIAITLSITGPCRLMVDAKGVKPETFWTGFHDDDHRAEGIELVKRALDLLNTLLEHSDAE